MQISIIRIPWEKKLYGLSRTHDPAQKYGDEIVALLGTVWDTVHQSQLTTTGINHVVYSAKGEYFCGLECPTAPEEIPGLMTKQFKLGPYAYTKHSGPFEALPETYSEMQAEMKKLGLRPVAPSVEIYGHWNAKPDKLVTELLVNFRHLPK